jgi:acetolactate synthase-1/2/3 large subunit
MAQVKVSDYVVQKLVEHGIRHVFMVSGGGAMHLVDSVGRNTRIQYICNHHEQASAIAAEGYARAIGKMAAVIVISGPGSTNTLTGVIGQWLDSIPCLYISGQVKRETTIKACPNLKLRQLGDQEINIIDIVRPVTKYSVMVLEARRIGYYLDKAIYLANDCRPGPVWLDIPLDIQAATIDTAKLIKYNPQEKRQRFNKTLIRQQVKQLLERIDGCKRPVLLAGHGIRLAGAVKQFEQLIRILNIPVLTTICGNDLIYSSHPLFFGRPGICGDRLGNIVLQNSDLLICIGARLGIRQIGYNYEAFARGAYRVMIDVDKSELEKPTLHMHMKIHADALLFIEEMIRQIGSREVRIKRNWINWAKERRQKLPPILQDNFRNPKYVNSYIFADALFKRLSPGDLIVTGNGSAYTSTLQIMKVKKGVRVIANQGCASMGYDLPAAIGACFARKKRQVVLITGDGSIQMNIQELQTIVTHKLPIKIFVLNNKGYLSIRATQDTYFKGRHYASSRRGGILCPDISRISKAYGINAIKLHSEKNLDKIISKVLKAKSPMICEIFMDPLQTLFPKAASEIRPDGKLVSRPLEDMYPFLKREELKSHMLTEILNK